MKKLYLFYITGNELNSSLYPGIGTNKVQKTDEQFVALYGWTPNKHVRNRFRELRDMTKFIEDIRYIDDCDFDKYADDYASFLLEDRAVTTQIPNKDSVFKKSIVLILSTPSELDFVTYHSNELFDEKSNEWFTLSNDTMIPTSDWFIEKYYKSLQILEFDKVNESLAPYEENGLPFNFFDIDSLAVYCKYFINTYRKDVDSICESMNSSDFQILRKTTKKKTCKRNISSMH